MFKCLTMNPNYIGKRYYGRYLNSYFIICIGLVVLALFSTGGYYDLYLKTRSQRPPEDPRCEVYDSIRCANGGSLRETDDGQFACKCTDEYYGEHCTLTKPRTLKAWASWALDRVVKAGAPRGQPVTWWLWPIFPFASELQTRAVYEFYQTTFARMNISNDRRSEAGSKGNMTGTRILPPARPPYCLTDRRLPSLNTVYDKIVRTKTGRIETDPKRRNLLFHAFHQYFFLQFFDAHFNSTVTASQLYGADETTAKELRTFSDGKLKTEYIDGEHYPPYRSSASRVHMMYPSSTEPRDVRSSQWFDRITTTTTPGRDDGDRAADGGGPEWAMGHPLLSTNPGLFVVATLWVREHNRLCDRLSREHPAWTDEQVYGTARRIVIGQMMRLMIGGGAVGGAAAIRPALGGARARAGHGRLSSTPLELLLIAMWPAGAPITFDDNSAVISDGLSSTVRRMMGRPMAEITHGNGDEGTEPMAKLLMSLSRENSVQGFNNYRRKLGLDAYGSFYELTGNAEVADKLDALYRCVDDVELLAGMLTERTDGVAPTAAVIADSLVANSILTDRMWTEPAWNPDTFGGDYGFDLVKGADVETFVCNNLADRCDGFRITMYA